MEYKDCKNLSNAELRLYQKALEDEYEVVKRKISDLFKTLDKMDIEYNKVNAELNQRRSMKF
jgi:hypothetical protein